MGFISDSIITELKQKMLSDLPMLGKLNNARKNANMKISVNHNLAQSYVDDGWEIETIQKTKTKLIKPKSFSSKFEDDVWCQMYRLGFRNLNFDETLELPFGKNPEDKKQIDILAIKDDIALIIECKSSKKSKKYFAKDEFELLNFRLDGFRKTLEQLCGRPLRVKYVLATRNLRIDLESVDMKRFVKTNSYLHNDNSFRYVDNLISKYKGVAEYQFLGLLFRNEIINNKKIEIPALEGKMGGLTYYMFSIEPGTLLKMSFILHRTKANEEEMPTYQRLLVPTRLKSLTKFIDGDDGEGGGFFPNSLILNLNTTGKHKIDFVPGKGFKNTNSKFGTLVLPNAYRIAYVIDGQHRLYGYANSKFKDSSTVPVVAFTDLPSFTQLKMFIDINENQKAVSKTLRETLKKDLGWNSKKASERMGALASAITIKLAEDSNSPFFDMIAVGEDKALLKMGSFTDSIKSSGLIPKARGNVYDASQNSNAFLYDIKNQNDDQEMKRCLKDMFKLISLVYEYIEKNYSSIYNSVGEFIISDRGVLALINLIGKLNCSLVESGKLNIKSNPEERFQEFEKYIAALCNGIENVNEDEKTEVLKSYGAGRVDRWVVFFMSLINKSINDYKPDQLIEWEETKDQELQDSGRNFWIYVESYMKKTVIYNLKNLFGEIWDLEINAIKRKCMERAEEERELQWKNFQEKVDPHWTEMFEVSEYKNIIKKYWTKKPENLSENDDFKTFEEVFTLDIGLGNSSKDDKTKWIDKLNVARRTYGHQGTKEKGLPKKTIKVLEKFFDNFSKISLTYPPNKLKP